MKTYRIPCTWTVAGTIVVKANNLEEAIFEAENNAPLPTDNDYIEGSFEVNNQMIPYLNKNLTETEMTEHCGEVIRW
jgi:hypothetical protein